MLRHNHTRRGRALLLIALAALLGACGANAAPAAPAENMVISERQIADQYGAGKHTRLLIDPHPPYNSNPPTSGWHYGGGWLEPGVYTEPQPDELSVHSLEHGMVVIHYRQDLDKPTVARLAALAQKLAQQNPCIVVVPRPAARLDVPLAVTAWTWLLELKGYDEAAITSFYRAHVGRGPEQICQPVQP